jgi:hypothetical protein
MPGWMEWKTYGGWGNTYTISRRKYLQKSRVLKYCQPLYFHDAIYVLEPRFVAYWVESGFLGWWFSEYFFSQMVLQAGCHLTRQCLVRYIILCLFLALSGNILCLFKASSWQTAEFVTVSFFLKYITKAARNHYCLFWALECQELYRDS